MTGRQEIWQTIHAVLEVLWASQRAIRNGEIGRRSEDEGPSEQDPSVAMATAQSILDAAEITLPTGDLHNGVYDAQGNYYQLPHHIVSDPTNLSWHPGTEEDDLDDTKTDLTAEETAEELEDCEGDAERRREEKGKAVVNVRDLMTVRARLSDGSRDVNVSVGKEASVRSIARQIAEDAQVSFSPSPLAPHTRIANIFPQLGPSKKVKIAYMGKILKDNISLQTQGYKQGHVVNALVFNR